MKALAVIPARGGSTRLKDKNIYPLGNKPLIRWITESVVASECFDQVLISTDDDRIFDAVSDLDVVRHNRPAHHATVQATVLDAMIDLIGEVDELDTFSYFLPTSPFIGTEDIKKGIDFFKDQSIDSVVGMTLMPAPIQLACIISNDDVLPVFDNLECGMTNSKFIKKYYKPSGFYMSRWDNLLKHKNFFKGRVKGVIMPPERSIDIDTIEDINHAESIIC
jgi:CMP-N-acetylneuraminic acid synthetase